MIARRADELSGLGRWREARAEYKRHLSAHPEDVDARQGLGVTLLATADAAGAVAEFDRVLAAEPDRFPARYQRAVALAALHRYQEAVDDLDRLIVADPAVWYLWSDRGGVHARAGRLDDALLDLEEAVRLAPGEAGAHLNLGLVLAQDGRFAEAHRHLTHAARAGAPVAARARDSVRRALLARSSDDDVDQAVLSVLAATSADEVAAIADAHPFVLTEAFVDLLGEVADSPELMLPSDAWRRVEDLRLLLDDVVDTSTVADTDSFGLLVDRLTELHKGGDHAAAYALAPQVARRAEEEFGAGSVEHVRQLGSWAVLALRVDGPDAEELYGAAHELLSRVDRAALVRLLVSRAAVRSGAEAEQALEEALAVVRDPALRVEAADVLRVYRTASARLSRAGRYAAAEELLREAVTRVEGDPLADLCSALAEAVFRQGRIAEALPWCERALAIRRAEHGETHSLVAVAMRDLGHLHRAARDIGAAESWLTRAAGIWRRLPGHDGDVAAVEADLASLYAAADLAEPARAAAARALEALDRRPEPDDSALEQLGHAYQALNDDESARAVLERLVAVRRVRVPSSGSLANTLNALANTHYREGRFDEALSAYRESLEIVEAATPDDVDTAFRLRHNVANALYRQGSVDAAFAAHDEAFAEYRRHRPDDDPELLRAVLAVADLHWSAGDEARAEELLAEVRPHLGSAPEPQAADLLEQARAALHDDRPDEAELLFGRLLGVVATDRDVATVKFGLARARLLRGTRTGVVKLLRESLDLCGDDEESADAVRVELAEVLGHSGQDDEAVELLTAVLDRGDEQHRGRTLAALGAAMQRRGALLRAQQLLGEAVTFADEHDVADNRVIGRRSLALALVRTHDLDEAYETAAAAIDLALDAFGPDGRLTALAELTYARVLTADGRPADAEPVIRRALAALERILRPEHPDLVSAMNDLAHSLLNQGEPYRAIPWFSRALAIDTESGGASGAAIARNLAVALVDLGDFATAKNLVTEAMSRIQAERGSEHPSYGVALATLGQVELADGDLVAASDHLVTACRILDDVLGPDHETAITAKGHLGELYLTIGARDTALSFAVSAEHSARALYGADNPSLAPHLARLARSRAFTGDPDEAERLYREALALVPWSRAFLLSLAELQIAIGKHEDALATLERTIDQEDADLPRSLSGATGPQRTTGFARLQRTVHDYLNLLVHIGDQRLVRRAWELTVRRRGLDADYLELRAIAPKSAGQHRELAHVRADISRAVLTNTVDDLPRLRRRRDELEQLLAARVPGAVLADRVASIDTDAVIAALPADTTLIDLVRTEWIDFANRALGTPPDRDGLEIDRTWRRQPARYLAFVLTATADSGIRMVDLGPTNTIDDLVRRLRGAIYQRTPDPEAADALSASVLMPLLRHVSTERLLVAADGPIAELPWQILPTGPDHLLVDSHTVSYLSSPREVLRWKADGPTTAPLVVGAPDFDLDAAPSPHGLPRLKGTRAECSEVAELLAVEPLVNRSATKSAVLATRSPTVLHLATHGLFLPPAKPPEQDYVYDTAHMLKVPGEGVFMVDAKRRLPRRPEVDPLLSSAVALAGFNAWIGGLPTPPDVDSGVLTAEEVCGMDLRNTRLAVLSACETGLGHHSPGEGVLGLRWALAVAGARTVVTTLWKVPDEATRKLMVLFYQRLLAGDPTPDALRAAQRTMRGRGSGISAWGAFVAHGRPTGVFR